MEINKSNLNLQKVDIKTAQLFCEISKQSSFFTNPKYICNFEKTIDWWIVSKGQEKICLWPIFKSKDHKVDLPLFSYYFGPVWSDSYMQSSNHSQLSKRNNVFDIFLKKFIQEYTNLVSQLNFSDHDIRFFIWWNNNKQKEFKIYPKYSSVIEDLSKKSENDIIMNFRELRRRMLKKAQKNQNILLSHDFTYDEIISLYKETLKRKSQEVEKNVPEKIKTFYDLCSKNYCKMIGYREKSSGKLISIILIAYDNKTSNLVLNLSSFDWKDSGVTALNMLNAIKYTKDNGLNNFDFNGANSPIGADDKQSYGGNYKLYFEIKLD